MKKLIFCLLSLLSLLGASPRAPAAEKLNIVFILADDLGWTDLGCRGSTYYQTPQIDQLAKESLRFTSAYTCGPNCQPTRACLMTGRYGPRHGVYTVGSGARGQAKFRAMIPAENHTSLDLDEVTVAEVLKKAGYATGLFGKWHLGPNATHHPTRQGFDEAIVSMGKHFDFATSPRVKVPEGAYLADFLTDHALRFLEANRDKPFFLYLPHFAVHSPLQAREDLIALAKKQKPAGGHQNPVYSGMISSVDASVGRVLARLKELGLEKNTVVIFSSDNGGLGGYAAAGVQGAKDVTNNAPLRGGKGMLYEGGIRVPFLVRWPGVIRPGSTCDTPIASVDLLPTLAELAGTKPPQDRPIDGVSLVSLLRSSGKDRLEREALYWHFPGYLQASGPMGTWRTTPAGAMRSGKYKLLEFFEDDHIELYNLDEDISEKHNLAQTDSDRARKMREQMHSWRKKVNAPMPKKKPDFAPPKKGS